MNISFLLRLFVHGYSHNSFAVYLPEYISASLLFSLCILTSQAHTQFFEVLILFCVSNVCPQPSLWLLSTLMHALHDALWSWQILDWRKIQAMKDSSKAGRLCCELYRQKPSYTLPELSSSLRLPARSRHLFLPKDEKWLAIHWHTSFARILPISSLGAPLSGAICFASRPCQKPAALSEAQC